MSSLLDKIRTLINARLRGPRHPTHRPAEPGDTPSARAESRPEVAESRPEVSEGHTIQPQAEVSEGTSRPGEMDEGRVADLLKKKQRD